jgi:hypothetical protein
MLSIDLKPSNLNPTSIFLKHTPSSSSLNRVSRLRELVRVNDENKVMSFDKDLQFFVDDSETTVASVSHIQYGQVGKRF